MKKAQHITDFTEESITRLAEIQNEKILNIQKPFNTFAVIGCQTIPEVSYPS